MALVIIIFTQTTNHYKLAQAGIAFDAALTFEGDNMMQSGYAAVMKFLEQKAIFSAILACNDDMALGAMRALHEHGLSIPSDVSVIGINDEPQRLIQSLAYQRSLYRLSS